VSVSVASVSANQPGARRICRRLNNVSGQKRTYKTLEPGPYWPDTGQAHTTCKALLVAVTFVAVAVAFRATRVSSSDVEESAGMTSHLRRDGVGIK
jgi:hypothetical protein